MVLGAEAHTQVLVYVNARKVGTAKPPSAAPLAAATPQPTIVAMASVME